MTEIYKKLTIHKSFLVLMLIGIFMLMGLNGFRSANASVGDVFDPEQPIHHKTVTKNEDGTYTLSLDVEGDSINKQSVKPVDVVLIMDVTSSMKKSMNIGSDDDDDRASKPTRMEVAHDAAIRLVDEILGEGSINDNLPEDQKTRISLVRFGGHAECNTSGSNNSGPAFTSNPDVLKKNIDKYINKSEHISDTNWSVGFEKANSVISHSARPNADKVIVFMTDGEPNHGKYSSSGLLSSTTAGSKYRYGNWVIKYLTNKDNPISQYDKIFNVFCGKDNGSGNTLMKAMSGKLRASEFLDGEDKAAFDNAFEKIADQIYHKYTFTETSIYDALSNWVDFKLDSDGLPQDLKFEKIDKKTGHIDEINGINNFQFNPSDKSIVWKPTGEGDLKKNTCYRVSFKITPNQSAFDKAAQLERAGKTPPDLSTDNEKGFYTNKVADDGSTDAIVNFKIRQKLEDDHGILKDATSDEITKEYEKPVIQIPTSVIKVNKVWDDEADHTDDVVNYRILMDNNEFLSGQLDSDNEWTDEKIVAAGPDGHTYNIKEVDVLDGYEVNVRVDDGEYQTLDNADIEYQDLVNELEHTVTFKNTANLALKVVKYKESADINNLTQSDLINNAEFTLYKHTHPEDKDYFDSAVDGQAADKVAVETTQNGTLVFKKLSCGSYWLKETKAPAGFTLCDALRIDIERNNGKCEMWITRYEYSDSSMVAQERVKIDMNDEVGLIKIAEKEIPDLPSAGSFVESSLVVLSFALISSSGYYLITKKKV